MITGTPICQDAISIHTSRAGCDQGPLAIHFQTLHFNPRIPCGMRSNHLSPYMLFTRISIHASHAGCDHDGCISESVLNHFNPRIPCGMRPAFAKLLACPTYFNPRIPCGMRPAYSVGHGCANTYFNPRIPCGMRRISALATSRVTQFQSTHPVRDATARWR